MTCKTIHSMYTDDSDAIQCLLYTRSFRILKSSPSMVGILVIYINTR